MSKILLIGCGKSKAARRSAAADLYIGSLFVARRKFAEATGLPWYVLSAKHGLLSPNCVIDRYDVSLQELNALDRAAWGVGVVSQILDELPASVQTTQQLREVVLEIHAGAAYAELIKDVIVAAGMNYLWPVESMSQGAQMRYYAQQSRSSVPS